MRPSAMATSAVRAGPPVPSTTSPPRITRSACAMVPPLPCAYDAAPSSPARRDAACHLAAHHPAVAGLGRRSPLYAPGMFLGAYHFDGQPDELVPAYDRLIAMFP